METMLSWCQIARSDVAKATELLRGGERGVRDEIGFLSLHQGFADRLFPGTSVLQTRLRYAVFVPWQISDLARPTRQRDKSAAVRLQESERALVLSLKQGIKATEDDDGGVIGIRSTNYQPAQPPSYVYWSALRVWGILQPVGQASWPSRGEALARVDGEGSSRQDYDDERATVLSSPLFFALPERPSGWPRAGNLVHGPLDFRLTELERKYLTDRLTSVPRGGTMGSSPSLLAKLAAAQRRTSWKKWNFDDPTILHVADAEDREAVIVARYAASLARVGRAVYGALVKYVANTCDGRISDDRYLRELTVVQASERDIAARCRLDEVEAVIGALDRRFYSALEATLKWLEGPASSVGNLWAPYRESEMARKQSRARLPRTIAAAKLRATWLTGELRSAERLNYRWHRVSQLLDDLHGVRW